MTVCKFCLNPIIADDVEDFYFYIPETDDCGYFHRSCVTDFRRPLKDNSIIYISNKDKDEWPESILS